jgi:hypothetical protein
VHLSAQELMLIALKMYFKILCTFSKVAGHKINIQKSVANYANLLYAKSKLSEIE